MTKLPLIWFVPEDIKKCPELQAGVRKEKHARSTGKVKRVHKEKFINKDPYLSSVPDQGIRGPFRSGHSLSIQEIEALDYYDFMSYIEVPYFHVGGLVSTEKPAELCQFDRDTSVVKVKKGN